MCVERVQIKKKSVKERSENSLSFQIYHLTLMIISAL